jgi:autotransporter-associated beta strand protein
LTLANTGDNDYTGTTVISGGTVRIGDGATIGGGNLGLGSVTNNASIVLNRPADDNFTVAANIGGSGTITKTGNNVATLSGANTFDGTVTISVGTLKLGSNSALGSTVGGTIVQNGATLDVGDFKAPGWRSDHHSGKWNRRGARRCVGQHGADGWRRGGGS